MRFFLTYLYSIIALSLMGQVPNYEFEVWEDFEIPTIADWNALGNVERIGNASNGDFAVKLSNKKDGSYGVVSNTNLTAALSGGTKYTDMPFVMRFDVKYNLAPNDTATVLAFFKVLGQITAQVTFQVTGSSADTFVRIKYPIQWVISTPPDSAIVVISSHTLETTVKGDGYLVFDNLVFETFGQPDDQIPNSNFENWDITAIPYPKDWYTTNLFVHDFYALQEDIKSVVSSKEAHYNTSILLQNTKVGSDILPGIAMTGKTFSDKFPPAFPVAKKWGYLNGYYKFDPQNKDTGIVAALLYKNGVLIGSGQLNFSKPESAITKFSLPLAYYSTLSPDSACIVLASSNSNSAKSTNTKLWIDKLTFSNSAALIEKPETTLTIYPNPVQDILVVESKTPISSVSIYDALGKCVLSSTQSELSVSHLAAGCYTVCAFYDSSFLMHKFVKL